MNPSFEFLKVSELIAYPIRELRSSVLDKLRKNIQQKGYYQARALSVIKNNGQYIVADGNHRLNILEELNIDKVPCVIYQDADPYKLAIDGNLADDTYAPMDLFDWLDIIEKLRGEGLIQQQIGDKVGWSRKQIGDYVKIIEGIAPEVLNLAKIYQEGRGTQNAPNGAFNFTEGWFRNSGIYALKNIKMTLQDEKDESKTITVIYPLQEYFMEWFIKDRKCNATTKLINEKIGSYKEQQEQLKILEEKLVQGIDKYFEIKHGLINAIFKGEYATNDRLIKVINKINEGAKNKALFGVDAIEQLKKIPDDSIDCVVTDPPWGVGFKPSRETDNPQFDGKLEENLDYLDKTFAEIKRVCKDNAHLYVFFPTIHYEEFLELLEKYFHVEPIPLIWVKNNHNPCDFKARYASQYETIFFCKCNNGNERKLNQGVSPDILKYDKVIDKYHDCQKPISLLKYLIENSSGKGEVILDPFMGSGATLLSAAKSGRYYIGFDIEKEYESKFKRFLGEIVK